MHARDIMTQHALTVTPAATVARAAELLATKGYRALPVVDANGVLVGMVTEGDLVQDRFPRGERRTEPDGVDTTMVRDVMTTPTVAMSPATDVGELAHKMISANHRCIPIVDAGRLVGVVTRQDIIRVLAQSDADIAAAVRKRLDVYGGVDRWTVDVRDGVARICDRYDDPADRPIAEALARSVAGCVRAFVHSGADSPTTSAAGNPA